MSMASHQTIYLVFKKKQKPLLINIRILKYSIVSVKEIVNNKKPVLCRINSITLSVLYIYAR